MAHDPRRFGAVFAASLLLLGAVGGAIMTGGVAAAVPTAGIGAFTVEFDELQGQGFTQYATIENASDCDAYPSAVASIDEGTITGLRLYKDVEVPSSMPGGGQTVRMTIVSDGETEFTGLTQKFTYLGGDLRFSDGQTIEQSESGEVKNRLSLSSPSITIENGTIGAQSQFVQSIALSNVTVKTTVNPGDSPDYPTGACAAS